MRPPIPYYGGKGRLAPWIASLIPPHRAYVEAFCGSAAVLFAKPRASHEVINDISGDVVTFFRTLRDQPDALARACQLSPYARDEYRSALLDVEGIDDLERARRVFVRATQAFNGDGLSAGRAGAWSNGHRLTGRSQARQVADLADALGTVADRLRGVVVEHRDAHEVIAAYDGPDVVFYLDPPYLGSTRTSLTAGDNRRRRDYQHDMPADCQHEALAQTLASCRATVLLSGYDSPLYQRLYAGWSRTQTRATRPTTNRPGTHGPAATEVVWSNRPLATTAGLFDPPPPPAGRQPAPTAWSTR
jgi:DNA adenine methylase